MVELEFFRKAYPSLSASYREFQKHLELNFGTPKSTSLGPEGFLSCRWTFEDINIQHYVFDRFGPEEHIRINCS